MKKPTKAQLRFVAAVATAVILEGGHAEKVNLLIPRRIIKNHMGRKVNYQTTILTCQELGLVHIGGDLKPSGPLGIGSTKVHHQRSARYAGHTYVTLTEKGITSLEDSKKWFSIASEYQIATARSKP